MTEYTGTDRRHLEIAVDTLEKTFAEQSQIVAKLLVVSENTTNAMARLERWVGSHEIDYRGVRERLLSQEIVVDAAGKRIETMTIALEATMQTHLADRSKLLGIWVALASAAAFVSGVVALFKSFGVI